MLKEAVLGMFLLHLSTSKHKTRSLKIAPSVEFKKSFLPEEFEPHQGYKVMDGKSSE